MRKYRTYANGITGYRYNGISGSKMNYYVVQGIENGKEKKGLFSVVNDDKEVIADNLYDDKDCEWFIDKLTASEKDLDEYKHLYSLEIFQINGIFVELMLKSNRTIEENKRFHMAERIRDRKVDKRAF